VATEEWEVSIEFLRRVATIEWEVSNVENVTSLRPATNWVEATTMKR